MANNRYKMTLTIDLYYDDPKEKIDKFYKNRLANDLLEVVNYTIKKEYPEASEWHSMVTIPTSEFVEELPESITRWDLREDND